LLTLNLGAPLFFVISGYCIASSLDSSRRKGTTPGQFLARRLWRIFPPYWASVLIIASTVLVLDRLGLDWLHRTGVGLELYSPYDLTWRQWFGNITLTETWRPLVGGVSHSLLLNRVAWALCYQEQFYLVCFLALILAPKRLFAALGLATIAIIGFQAISYDLGRTDYSRGLFPDLWHEFAVGLALYWRINYAESTLSKRAVELGLVILCAIGFAAHLTTTVAATGFGLLLLVCYRWDDLIARIGRLDPLRACGRRSYAVYLVHLPVCTIGNAGLAALGLSGFWPRVFLMIPTVTAVSVAAGWLFYDLVDHRFGKLPNWRKATPTVTLKRPIPPILAEADASSGFMPSLS
jgi:peptidoglycan/LPS O-acetylase OafA/YrhL